MNHSLRCQCCQQWPDQLQHWRQGPMRKQQLSWSVCAKHVSHGIGHECNCGTSRLGPIGHSVILQLYRASAVIKSKRPGTLPYGVNLLHDNAHHSDLDNSDHCSVLTTRLTAWMCPHATTGPQKKASNRLWLYVANYVSFERHLNLSNFIIIYL